MTTYQHGGDIQGFAKKAGCRVEEVIDLSSNINFVKPNIDVDFNTLDIAPYPNYDTLYEAVALRYGVSIDEMELFGGGSAAIFALFGYFKGRHLGLPLRCTIYSPAYLEYKKAASVFTSYFGKIKSKPFFGEGKEVITKKDIQNALALQPRLDIFILILLILGVLL